MRGVLLTCVPQLAPFPNNSIRSRNPPRFRLRPQSTIMLFMGVAQSSSIVLSFEEARHVVEREAASVQAPGSEAIDLLGAAHRVLAEQVIADRDVPPFPRSTRDGYAI